MDFEALNKKILPPDAQAEKAAWAHWDGIAKPLRGLGRLEEAVVRIAALTGSEEVELGKRAVLVLCADNGVAAEGVTQTDASVTATMAGEIAKHRSSVCRMAARASGRTSSRIPTRPTRIRRENSPASVTSVSDTARASTRMA